MSEDLLTLPVWTIRPNWAGGITERLDWLSNVLASLSGSEQRQAVRLSPRRSFEMTINPLGRDRSYADLFLHRLVAEEMLIPLWHDRAKLTAPIVSGESFAAFDNTYREHEVDQCALLYKDAFTWEVIYISASADSGLTSADPITGDWPAGTVVHPMRAARLSEDSNFSALTGRVGEAQLLFTMSRENDFAEDYAFDFSYGGVPVILQPPNRSESLDQAFQRILSELDNQTGRRRILDSAGRSFTTQIHNWMCNGRAQQHDIRKLLYYLRGRARAVWMPTFNEDVTVARVAALGASIVDIEKIGYAYTGGAVDGRKHVLLTDGSDYQGIEITGLGAALATDEERLLTGDTLDFALTPGQAFSFMDTARLDQDTVEITHHTDSDGVCEVSAAFRSFRNERDETPAPVHGIP